MTKKEKEQYLKLENVLGTFKEFFGTKVEVLDIIKTKKGFKKVVLRYTLSNNITYVSEHLIKYNTRHLDGYFEVHAWGVVPLNDNNKKYNKMKITWNVSWDFIKELLNK